MVSCPVDPSPGGSASFTFDETLTVELSASCRGSQFPVDPHASRGAPRPVARASASFTFDETLIVELSASSVGSQFPVDPKLRRGPCREGSRLGLLHVRRNLNRRVVGLKRRLAIPRRSHTSCGSLAGRLAPRPPSRSTKH